MKLEVKEEWKIETGKYKCPYCNKEYSKKGICSHIWKMHGEGKDHDPNKGYKDGNRIAWNKGLTMKENPSIQQASETFKKRIKSGNIIPPFKGKNLSEYHKQKISEGMKKAHSEKRAWNIGKSRWNNKPSYPESFFIRVIENEFDDQNYIREFPFSIYSLDFAWPDKKLCIEIDGEQHERFKEYKERDIKKDKLLMENGWKVLRIKWINMFHDTKYWIEKSKSFIDN